MLCNSCDAVRVNGVKVHEHGCPEAYKDYSVPCFESKESIMPLNTKRRGPGSLHNELVRTSEMLVSIAQENGIYFAVAFLYDSSYDSDRILALLPILQHTQGAIK